MFKKRGFQDRLYWMNLKFAWVFTAMCFILNALSGVLMISDLAIITYGMSVVWAEVGLHTGFMIWKAKTENCRKYKDINGLEEWKGEL